METRANFVLIGAFTMAAVVGAFLFVMWIATVGGGSHRRYQIIFSGSVSGLSTGSSVLFNGLKVGEVMALGFVKGNPSQVVADIDVTNESAPINSDTKAQLETQGLTGSGVVALIGGEKGAAPLEGQPPIIPSLPTATLADLQTKAGYVLDLANKLLVDNAEPIHRTLENAQNFSQALARNTDGVDAALQGVADLGKAIQPLATKLQALADHSDTLVSAIDPAQVRAIVTSVEQATAKANATIDQANKLISDNTVAVRSTLENVDSFTRMLNDNRDNVQTALKGAADFGKSVQPLVAQLQGLSENANRVVSAIDAEKLRAALTDAQTFTQALASSSSNYQKLMGDGAAFVSKLNGTSEQISSVVKNVDLILKAVDPQKVSGIVDSVNGFATTLSDNRPNIDDAFRNANEITAKLNKSADKVDGVLTSAQNFLGSPGTQGAVQQIGEAAQSVKKLADNLDARVKDIGAGLARFSNSGLRQYEALAVQGQRVLDDVDRVVRSFERNPGQLIWGARPPLPEYRGQQ
jgi:phospholipid/cholesterol/gamma-HCH transport system substrate-binding protein